MIYAGAIELDTGTMVLLLLLALVLLAMPVLAIIGLGILCSGLYQRYRSAPAAAERLEHEGDGDGGPANQDRWDPQRHHDARVARDRGQNRIVIGLCLMVPCAFLALRFIV